MDKTKQHKGLLPIDKWQVDTLRLTLFASTNIGLEEPTWWRDVFEKEPLEKKTRPVDGTHQQIGDHEGRIFILSIRNQRIDWICAPDIGKIKRKDAILSIGAVSTVLDLFIPPILRWFELETCPAAKRLAFGAMLFYAVADQEVGNRLFSDYLPHVKLDDDNIRDFGYQINRRRQTTTGIPGLNINRLAKWSMIQAQPRLIELSPDDVSIAVLEQDACRLELDMNTSAEFKGNITREQLPALFQELAELGKQIVEEGDVP